MTSTPLDLGRPVAGDVVELILEDHRRFEALLRQLRDSSTDRDAVRWALAALHVAHAEAEEKLVYPVLRTKRAIGEHEEEHGQEGLAFAEERAAQIDADCGRLENVRKIVARAERAGILPAEDGV